MRVRPPRRFAAWAVWCLVAGTACEDTIQPQPPKQLNLPPSTFLEVGGDTLEPQLYRLTLRWLGTDPDGRVAAYRYRWRCESGAPTCLVDSNWTETTRTSESFTLPVPDGTARYVFEVAAIDDDAAVGEPARQAFDLFNTPPVANFQPGTLPQSSLPAITFYFTAVDPDTTSDETDADSRSHLDRYRYWLDGWQEPREVPISSNSATLRLADFADNYGTRTIFMQVLDDGGAASPVAQHEWVVESAPQDGVLLVDDCRRGGFLETRSDQSYRNVLEPAAAMRLRIMDIEALPRVSQDDLEATLELFPSVVWYTDADNVSSGALELARGALLDLLENRQGRLFLSSGLVFGTGSAFADLEGRFRELFGLDSVVVAPNGTTNWGLSQSDTITAAVHPGLDRFRMLSLGLGAIMDCFQPAPGARSLYFYPPGVFVRGEFVNPVQYDIGVYNETGSARTVIVSFPIGLPINSNMGENENEIRELLRLAGILD